MMYGLSCLSKSYPIAIQTKIYRAKRMYTWLPFPNDLLEACTEDLLLVLTTVLRLKQRNVCAELFNRPNLKRAKENGCRMLRPVRLNFNVHKNTLIDEIKCSLLAAQRGTMCSRNTRSTKDPFKSRRKSTLVEELSGKPSSSAFLYDVYQS